MYAIAPRALNRIIICIPHMKFMQCKGSYLVPVLCNEHSARYEMYKENKLVMDLVTHYDNAEIKLYKCNKGLTNIPARIYMTFDCCSIDSIPIDYIYTYIIYGIPYGTGLETSNNIDPSAPRLGRDLGLKVNQSG